MHPLHVQHHISFWTESQKERDGGGVISVNGFQNGRESIHSCLSAQPDANRGCVKRQVTFISESPRLHASYWSFVHMPGDFSRQQRRIAIKILDSCPCPLLAEVHRGFQCVRVEVALLRMVHVFVSAPDQTRCDVTS